MSNIFKFKHFFLFLAIVSFLFFTLGIFTNNAEAAIGINRQINFQGKLVNNPAATNVTDTSYTVVFTLYDNSSGGTALWTETQTVTTVDGIFRVALGSVTPFPANFNFNWSGLYLGIKVNSDAEMTPRVQMASVPFAFNAQQVAGLTVQDTSGNASTSGTLQVANAKTVSFADAFTTSGAFPLTLTTTNTTSLTLPTTGILLTNTAAANQTITSTQTSGNLLSLVDSTGLTSAITGLTVGLTSSTNSQNKTGISFDLSGGTGGIYYDLLGTGSTWSITRAGALTVASCSGCGSSSGYSPFQELQGAIVPNNSTMDLLVGGQATTSAKFAITNVAAGTPIATLSASTNNNGLVLSAVTSTIQSLRNNALILGGDTTGEVTIAEITNLGSATTGLQITTAGQISDIDGSGVSINDNISLVAGTSRSISIIGAGGGSLTIQSSSDTTPSGVGGNLLLAGGSGSNDGSGGTIYIYGGTGGTKGNVILANNGTTSIGLVGIGTATPLASFDVRANINNGGTISVASVSGTTSFAALVANNDGVGDLFTASASSQTRFVVKNNGQLLANAYPTCTLKTDNTGLVTCGTDNTGGAGTSPFAELSGAIVPNNSTEDFLVGGQSTTSAVFSILNVAKNQPVASASGQFILMPNNGWGGQVGIGYNNPGTATLAVNGNVGIGTTAPLENLAVGNGITNQSFSVASASNNKMYFSTWYDTAYFSINRNSATGVFANTSLGAANLGFISDSTGGYFEFNTANSPNSNPVFRMRLDENGNLGIGTNSPTAPLQVNGAYGSNAGLIINQLNNGDLLTASYSGITKFNVSNTGKLVLGTSTNGLTFDPASGPTYNGTAQLVKKITLSPEYAGATLTASGSATTTGTMTADASPSANWRTYYQWSSTQGTMQDYTLALRVTLPNDFSAWATSNAMTIDFDTATTNATQNKLDVLIFNPSDAKPTTPVLMNTANVSSAGYTWTTNTYPATSFTGGTAKWQTAGQTAVIYLHMYSASPGVIQVGDIVLNYYAKF